jgi:hypothetical protein
MGPAALQNTRSPAAAGGALLVQPLLQVSSTIRVNLNGARARSRLRLGAGEAQIHGNSHTA